MKVERFIDENGKNIVNDWIDSLRDKVAKAAILKRFVRLESGNFGDSKTASGVVNELRIDVGAGYRVYYVRDGNFLVLLLCGGDKSSQTRDINRSKRYWKQWQQRPRSEV